MPDDETEVAVARSGDQDRYGITVDGQPAGVTEYVDDIVDAVTPEALAAVQERTG